MVMLFLINNYNLNQGMIEFISDKIQIKLIFLGNQTIIKISIKIKET